MICMQASIDAIYVKRVNLFLYAACAYALMRHISTELSWGEWAERGKLNQTCIQTLAIQFFRNS